MVENDDIKARLNEPVVIVPRRVYPIEAAEIVVVLITAGYPNEKPLEQTLTNTRNDVAKRKILPWENRRDRITPVAP